MIMYISSRYTSRERIGCLIFIDYFPQKSPIIIGSLAKNDLQLKASCGHAEQRFVQGSFGKTHGSNATIWCSPYSHTCSSSKGRADWAAFYTGLF